jgi:mRNA interferase HicA
MREHGAEIKREGAKHTIWFIPATGQKSTVPRHNEIKKNTARAICKQLGILIEHHVRSMQFSHSLLRSG